MRELRAGGAAVRARHAVISGGARRHVVIIGRCPSHCVNEETAGKRVMAGAGIGADDNGAVSGKSDNGVLPSEACRETLSGLQGLRGRRPLAINYLCVRVGKGTAAQRAAELPDVHALVQRNLGGAGHW